MSPSLFSLPDDVCIPLFAVWIEITDLAVFDTSLCNRIDRNQFHDLFRSSNFVQKTQGMHTTTLYFNWLAQREIRVENLHLENDGRKNLNPTIWKLKNGKLKHLEMEYCSNLVHLLDYGHFTIDSLSLVESETLNDERFAELLSKIKELTYLDISSCTTLTDAACDAIILNCPKLTGINVLGCDGMTSHGLIKIAKYYNKQIEKLTLNNAITNIDLCQIAQSCPNLIEIEADDCDLLTDVGILKLAECCVKLECLSVSGKEITDNSIMKLAQNCTHLQKLSFVSSGITDISLVEISKYCNIKNDIILQGCTNITDVGLCAVFTNYTVLTTIALDCCPLVTDITVECIANNCRKLESIGLFHCSKVTDTSLLLLLDKCNQLRDCSFSGTQATSTVYNQIANNCDFIYMIDNDPCEAAEEVIDNNFECLSRLELSKHTRRNGVTGLICRLDVLSISLPAVIGDIGVGVNYWYSKLTDFRIDSEMTGVTDSFINILTICCPLLHTVYLVNCNNHDITYRSFESISERLTQLHSLKMSVVQGINDEMVIQFLTLRGRNMRVFGLFQCGNLLTDLMIYAISEHCSECLVELNVCGLTTITNDAISTIIYTCKKLSKLNISYCHLLSDQILFEISQHCECLRELNIRDCTDISHDSIVEFLMYYRQLNVLTHSDGVRVENL